MAGLDMALDITHMDETPRPALDIYPRRCWLRTAMPRRAARDESNPIYPIG